MFFTNAPNFTCFTFYTNLSLQQVLLISNDFSWVVNDEETMTNSMTHKTQVTVNAHRTLVFFLKKFKT